MDLDPSDVLNRGHSRHRMGDHMDGMAQTDQFLTLCQSLSLRATFKRVKVRDEVTNPKGARFGHDLPVVHQRLSPSAPPDRTCHESWKGGCVRRRRFERCVTA